MVQLVQSVKNTAARFRSALLLVRSTDDLAVAIAGANEFSRHRRRCGSPSRDEILGVWLRPELDADLPVWPSLWPSLHPATSSPDGAKPALGVCESLSLSGIWSLCWLDGALLSACQNAKERRFRVVDCLVRAASGDSSSSNLGVFLSVFDDAEDSESIAETLQELRARFEALISVNWFVDELATGLSGRRSAEPADCLKLDFLGKEHRTIQ